MARDKKGLQHITAHPAGEMLVYQPAWAFADISIASLKGRLPLKVLRLIPANRKHLSPGRTTCTTRTDYKVAADVAA